MDIHQNARLTPYSREQLAKFILFQGRTLNSAAAEFKVSGKTARKWVRRYQSENRAGMADRSSRPHRLRRPTEEKEPQQTIVCWGPSGFGTDEFTPSSSRITSR